MKSGSKYIVDLVWHWKIEDGLPWSFCSKMLKQDHYELSGSQIKKEFLGYFFESANTVLYSKCPECKIGELLPRKSIYGYFVSCSCFPNCNYKVGCDRSID